MKYSHKPVMLQEAIQALNIQKNGQYIDCTFGSGKYARLILESGGQLIAFDRDPLVYSFVQEIYNQNYRFPFFQKPFSCLQEFVKKPVDGIVADLGMSSMQLDDPSRGFSFRYNAPLDMRMGHTNISAFDVINKTSYNELVWILRNYGNEYDAPRIVDTIIKKRPIYTTYELANLISKIKTYKKIHPATKTFQAIRISVNQELQELETLLKTSVDLLKKNGKLVIVTFHSIEDRMVKHFWDMKKINRHTPSYSSLEKPVMKAEKKIKPSTIEIFSNPRSRSATLRTFIRQ